MLIYFRPLLFASFLMIGCKSSGSMDSAELKNEGDRVQRPSGGNVKLGELLYTALTQHGETYESVGHFADGISSEIFGRDGHWGGNTDAFRHSAISWGQCMIKIIRDKIETSKARESILYAVNEHEVVGENKSKTDDRHKYPWWQVDDCMDYYNNKKGVDLCSPESKSLTVGQWKQKVLNGEFVVQMVTDLAPASNPQGWVYQGYLTKSGNYSAPFSPGMTKARIDEQANSRKPLEGQTVSPGHVDTAGLSYSSRAFIDRKCQQAFSSVGNPY